MAKVDLGAYLTRIGHTGTTTADAVTLSALHRAHVDAIPFENLDVILGRGIDTDLGAIQDKLVVRRRGGYCYEHGLLFAAALQQLGFTVRRHLARVGDRVPPGPRSHLVLSVDTGSTRWLADVGFGSGLLHPIPVDGTAHHQEGWTYRVTADGQSAWELQEQQPPGSPEPEQQRWATVHRFAEEEVHPVDVVVANHFTSTWPNSPFVRQLVAVRKDARAVHRLLGRHLSLTRADGHVEREQVLTDTEVADALARVFGLHLDAEELDHLTAALPTTAGAR